METATRPIPRGLIRTRSLEALYDETRSVELDLRESKTSEFWEDILHDVFLKNDTGYSVNAQQPPNEESRKYCDFIVATKNPYGQKVRLIVIEAKRLRVYASLSQMQALETQLLGYCQATTEHVPMEDAPFIFGLAVVGTRGRMYRFSQSFGLQSFSGDFADDAGQNKDGYRDAAEEVWHSAFLQVKQFPPSGGFARRM